MIAGLLVPALVLERLRARAPLARRPRSCWLLALVGLLAMAAGFPEGTPLRRAMNFTYNHVAPLQFLRTTYKAGPLLALALAGLGGLAAARAAPWLRARGRALPARRAGGARRARRGRVLAARARAGAGLAARPGTAIPPAWTRPRRTTSTRRSGERRARGRAPRPALRGLRLGRDGRRDPARAGRAPGGRALRGALRRPARGRPAVDGRRARAAAARAARPARPAAGPAVARAPWSPGPTTTAPAAGRSARPTPPTCSTSSARPTRPGARCGSEPRAAGTLGPAAPAAARARLGPAGRAADGAPRGRRGRRRSSTAAPTRSRAWPRSARCPRGRIAYAGDASAGRRSAGRARS